MSKNVLVTGGAGYIGSHACKALAKAGYNPIVYDNLIYGHKWAAKWGPLEIGDILDSNRLDEVIKKYQPEAVMHFAAYAYVGESVKDPAKYYRNNVTGTITLLEAMKKGGIDKIIFSSTCATYGIPTQVPICEDHSQNPINPYGWSKLMIEQILRDFHMAYSIRSVALRYFNAAGADPDGEIGERHNPETHLIPLVLEAAAGRRPNIAIFGTDYPTTDGTCIRDYIHVRDLADAHVMALNYLYKENKSTAFNLGNGSGFSVREIIEISRKVTGKKIQIVEMERRAGDPAILVGNAAKIESQLGWRPQFSDIATQITHAWEWMNSFK
ncbi:MAG: galE [Firmicutes bacterium]|nr:galE [Bacillota bacterium]